MVLHLNQYLWGREMGIIKSGLFIYMNGSMDVVMDGSSRSLH